MLFNYCSLRANFCRLMKHTQINVKAKERKA